VCGSRATTKVGKLLSDKSDNMEGKLYYDLESPDGLSTLTRMQTAARQHKHGMMPEQLTG